MSVADTLFSFELKAVKERSHLQIRIAVRINLKCEFVKHGYEKVLYRLYCSHSYGMIKEVKY